MKVVLRSDISGVGRRGDIVDVAGGFARNYLFPGGLAIEASDGVVTQAAAMRRARDLRETKDREAAQTKASVLGAATLRVSARAGANGRLFGSVGPTELAQAAREQKGVELDRHQIALDEPIKALGSYQVPVRLLADMVTSVTVEVVAAS